MEVSLEEMKIKFEAAIAKMITDKRQNNIILSPARYSKILDEVIRAKSKITGKTPIEYRRLKRYDVIGDKNGQKVLVVPGTVGIDKMVKYYARSDQLFSIIHLAHLSTNHGGREKVLNCVKANYSNVSSEIVMTYISACPKCQYKHGFRKVPGGGSGSPSSPGTVPIAPKKLSSMVPSSSSLPATLPTASPSSSVPPPPPEVCLRWNSYHSNMQATFPTLLNNEQFVDVTLACEGRSIKCHKVMLSACSSYFEELLSQNPCQHPIVFMRDLKFWEVQALVEFMYSGEVNVAQEKLPSLLAAAEALQIKGLTGPTQSSPQEESDYMPVHDSDEAPMSQTHKRVRKRKSTNPMAYPSRQPQQQSTKQMPMMHPIAQHSNNPLSSGGGISGSGIAQHPSPNRKESTSSYHPPVKIKKERELTPPLALIKEEPLDLGKDSMETGSNNGQDLSNASSSYQASNYDRSHYSGRSLGKPQNGLSDEEDQDRSSTHSNHSDETISPIEQKHDPGDDVSDV